MSETKSYPTCSKCGVPNVACSRYCQKCGQAAGGARPAIAQKPAEATPVDQKSADDAYDLASPKEREIADILDQYVGHLIAFALSALKFARDGNQEKALSKLQDYTTLHGRLKPLLDGLKQREHPYPVVAQDADQVLLDAGADALIAQAKAILEQKTEDA